MNRGQRGPASRFTDAEIAEIRSAYRLAQEARERRREVVARLGLHRSEFTRYGNGTHGKKPRECA